MNKPKSTRSKRPPSMRPAADDGDAFIPDVARSHTRLIDDDAESYAEEFIAEATSAEHIGEDARDERADDETFGQYFVDFTVLDEDEERDA